MVELDLRKFFAVVRSARRGSAAGLPGMTAEHLKPLLENESSLELLGVAASLNAEKQIDPSANLVIPATDANRLWHTPYTL